MLVQVFSEDSAKTLEAKAWWGLLAYDRPKNLKRSLLELHAEDLYGQTRLSDLVGYHFIIDRSTLCVSADVSSIHLGSFGRQASPTTR